MKEKPIHTISYKHAPLRWLKVIGGVVLCVIAIVVIFLIGITFYLTPDRLERIIKNNASDYFNAEIRVSNPRFSIWQTFPHFYLEYDSLLIVSHSLNGISESDRALLPADADTLASSAAFKGSVNLLGLLADNVQLHDVAMTGLKINLVALNDSVNNFNIIPKSSSHIFEIPRISTNSLRLVSPGPISYFSVASDSRVTASLSNAGLNRLADSKNCKNRYRMQLNGTINVLTDGVTFLRDFPFELDGNVDLRFFPFGAQLNDYAVNLGSTRGRLNVNLNLGSDMSIDKFGYSLETFRLSDLLSYLPNDNTPLLTAIDSDIDLLATARLTSPYNLSSGKLPSVEVNFTIPDGKISYILNSSQSLTLNRINCNGSFLFNGENPDLSRINIDRLNASGMGAEVSLSAGITDLFANPRVSMSVEAFSDVAKTISAFVKPANVSAAGKFMCRYEMSFLLNDIKNPVVTNLQLEGVSKLSDAKLTLPQQGVALTTDKLSVDLATQAATVSPADILNGLAGVKIDCKHLTCKSDADNFKVENLHILSDVKSGRRLQFISGTPLLPVDCKFNVGSFSYSSGSGKEKTSVAMRNLKGEVSLDKALKRKVAHTVKINSDSTYMAILPHSSTYLTFDSPRALRKFLSVADFKVDLKLGSTQILTPGFNAPIAMSSTRIKVDPDNITFTADDASAGTVRFRPDLEIGGLYSWFTTGNAVPLKGYASINMGVIDINELAHHYESGAAKHKGSAEINGNVKSKPSGSDSIALLIPRNLQLDVSLSARETIYTNLHLYNLDTHLKVDSGVARVDTLTIDSDFGSAGLGMIYDSSDIENLRAVLNLDINKIDVVTFFKRFHTLLEMMPQMSNLSGYVGANVSASLPIFPDMYLNLAGTDASLRVTGRELTVHQSNFIHHITRMLLIHTDSDLHIADMNVLASIHDNMLELYPFNFEVDRYLLRMSGLNNFAGDLYYHIGVDKSPVAFPFGINITGNFSRPKLHFGGAAFDPNRASRITSDVESSAHINIVKEGKVFLREFLHKAAQSYRRQDN